jgi:hypothetical protein
VNIKVKFKGLFQIRKMLDVRGKDGDENIHKNESLDG